MNTPTLFLDLLLFSALLHPSGVGNALYSFLPKKGRRLGIAINYSIFIVELLSYLLIIGLVLAIRSELGTIIWTDGLWHLIAVITAPALFYLEITVNQIIVRLKTGMWAQNISLNDAWKVKDNRLVLLLAVVIAIGEEVVFRQFFWGMAITFQSMPVAIIIILSALFYGLNHMRQGHSAVISKCFSGGIYSALFFVSGNSLLPPVICHVVQNLFTLFKLSEKRT